MPQGIVGPQGVTVISPPAREKLSKVAQLTSADGSTGFAAFGLPQNAFIAGVSIISAGANSTGTPTVKLGFTNGGGEILNAYAPDATGFSVAGDKAGSAVGTQLTADKTVYAKASAALTSTVTVIVDYWMPPVGQPY